MSITALLFSSATFVSTFVGGLFAIRFRDKLHLIMSFTAGVLLGVVCFDILPEIIEQAHANNMNPIDPMVALAVISHDFTDGMNTVTLMLHHKNTSTKSRWFLLMDAIAPVLGSLLMIWIRLPPRFLVLYLGFFAGFLLYIGASDILPEAHSQQSSYQKIGLTIAGVLFIFLMTRIV